MPVTSTRKGACEDQKFPSSSHGSRAPGLSHETSCGGGGGGGGFGHDSHVHFTRSALGNGHGSSLHVKTLESNCPFSCMLLFSLHCPMSANKYKLFLQGFRPWPLEKSPFPPPAPTAFLRWPLSSFYKLYCACVIKKCFKEQLLVCSVNTIEVRYQ